MADAERRAKLVQLAAQEVRQAIKAEGRNPHYHREILARHRRQWPILWEALDKLCLTLDHLGDTE